MPEPKIEVFSIPNATLSALSSEVVIIAPMDLVFNVISDVSFRKEWEAHVKVSDQASARIGQQRITHRSISRWPQKG